jgi:putative sigma-54 modulation protein
MRILSINGKNMDLTKAIKEYVEEKVFVLEKLTSNFEPAAELTIEVGKTSNHHAKGPFFMAEMQLSVPGELLRVEEKAEDLYKAIDLARDQLRRQLKNYKEKLQDRTHRGSRPDKD